MSKNLEDLINEQETPSPSWADILASAPPGQFFENVIDVVERTSSDEYAQLVVPNITLHCESTVCNGPHIFSKIGSGSELLQWEKDYKHAVLVYTCRHCRRNNKTFAVYVGRARPPSQADVVKFGEWPPYGDPVPPRVISLIGPDRDLFLNGRRAENQGLGIGAFAYYRRVVENQKDRIFDKIINAAKQLGAKEQVLEELSSAKTDFRFDRAIDKIKMGIPDGLKLKGGHNPLKLLHNALSKSLHQESDPECLQLAKSIRLVLTDLAERIDLAVKEQKEMDDAVARLLDWSKPDAED